ncbi:MULTISPECIES: aldo/keto reductase [unclassified Staphylococcus]|uniref:aldo/keto reductase n=1 Tax=unclassified Staphylococcus TaxID=91994 RepID=UPI0021D13087|nr:MULTISPECIES: aldo/keto reductase [unclassified Staphylococcus]UXR71979.1 aldo/keto reductase [Staphylococcus sp. IVB6240]UXR74287.1 aldo/keto reductase [Staphylococcus sp. IVB6238]UXR76674.1 aldo/keto reductase [Staphylococcus sp. IVB6233]UXR80803.1 aldo/keto reductase [Staphylococcus sp. IVB6218]
MKTIKINQHVSYSQLIQGFYRADKWKMSAQEMNRFLHELVERGITTMDHADLYGSYTVEKMFGEALALSPELRNRIQIVTKCGIVQPNDIHPDQKGHRYDLSETHIKRAVERSLQQLQVDYVDTLLIHRPSPLMKPCEITDALKTLVDEGKVRAFGVSNFRRSQYELLNECLKDDRFHIAVNQVEVSPYMLESFHDGTLDDMYKDKVKIMAWGPYAGGRLFDENDPIAQRVLPVLKRVAEAHHTSVEAVVVAWLTRHPATIMPILGTQRLERVDAAIAGLDISLHDQEWFDIYTAAQGYDIP